MQEIISKTVSDCGKTTELSSNDDKLSKMHTHTHTQTHTEKSLLSSSSSWWFVTWFVDSSLQFFYPMMFKIVIQSACSNPLKKAGKSSLSYEETKFRVKAGKIFAEG